MKTSAESATQALVKGINAAAVGDRAMAIYEFEDVLFLVSADSKLGAVAGSAIAALKDAETDCQRIVEDLWATLK